MSPRLVAVILVLCAAGCGQGVISSPTSSTTAPPVTTVAPATVTSTSTLTSTVAASTTPSTVPRSSVPPYVAPALPYDVARGPTPPCRERDATLPTRPFARQPIGDIDGDGRADNALIDLRSVSDMDGRREIYIAFGNGIAAGPLRGTYPSKLPFAPTDVHGGADLDGDGRAELIVALDANAGYVVGIARVDGCDIAPLHSSDGEVFWAFAEIFGHNCCPYHYATVRCAPAGHGVEIVATASYPIKDDGTVLSGFELFQSGGPDDPLDLTYSWTRTRWTIDGAIVRTIATEQGRGRGRDLAPELVTSGLDCFGVALQQR